MLEYQVWLQTPDGMERRPGHVAFELLPRGMSHFWYVLRNDDMQIQAVRYPTIQYPTVYIQIRARLVWAVGYQNALRYCLDVAQRIFGRFIRSSLSRVDFTVDIQGWKPNENYFHSRIVGRPVKLEKHVEYDTTVSAVYYRRKHFTGIRLGKGKPILVRFYDKSEEILVNGTNTWFYEVWKKNGWNGRGRVWRVEFQCRRKLLAAFGFGDSVESLDKFAGMFRYLTTDWIRLAVPNRKEKKRTRWKTAPVWKLIQGANFGDGGDIQREAQKLPGRKQLMDQFKGLSTTIAARYGVDNEGDLQNFIAGVLCGEMDDEQVKRLKKKKALYDTLSLVNSENKNKGLALRYSDVGIE